MTRDDFLARRKKGLGGSDMAAVLGLSRYRTPLELWQEKREPIRLQAGTDNEAMAIGRWLEPAVLQMYSQVRGLELVRYSEPIVHPDYPFLIGNLDASAPNRVVEAKTAFNAADWGEEGTAEIPIEYFLQCQHYMMLAGFPVADVPVFFRGERENSFRIYTVQADPELHQLMCQSGAEFWEKVQNGTPPEPTTFAEQARIWAELAHQSASTITAVDATPEIAQAVTQLAEVSADLKVLEGEKERLTEAVERYMGPATVLKNGAQVLATWRPVASRQVLQSAALEAAHPGLLAEFSRPSEPSRRFVLKNSGPKGS